MSKELSAQIYNMHLLDNLRLKTRIHNILNICAATKHLNISGEL